MCPGSGARSTACSHLYCDISPPKLESSMATYEMLSSFATGFFVLARQAAYMSHIENGFEQN